MQWIQHPVVLESERVKLVPLESAHFDELIRCSQDKAIWEFITIDGTDPSELRSALKSAMLMRMSGDQYPFVIIDKLKGNIMGSTRLMDIQPVHKGLEIGWTWYDPAYWRTGYNRECKLLLLTYCFEELKAIRVQLKTWDKNWRSRKAIEGIGAKFEGILRNHMIRYDGLIRDTAYFSIINEEWDEVKEQLRQKIKPL
jgi:RimJ/RimL family protein N-acetyltransferase